MGGLLPAPYIGDSPLGLIQFSSWISPLSIHMPFMPSRPCTFPRCGSIAVVRGRCEQHKHVEQRTYDKVRASSTKRGYGYRWQRYTQQFKRDNPLCLHCRRQGKVTPTQCVDHVQPVDGPDDPLFWDASNHQPLCLACHSVKTATEDGGFGNQSRPGGAGQISGA